MSEPLTAGGPIRAGEAVVIRPDGLAYALPRPTTYEAVDDDRCAMIPEPAVRARVDAAVAAEREGCARAVEALAGPEPRGTREAAARDEGLRRAAAAIRARGGPPP